MGSRSHAPHEGSDAGRSCDEGHEGHESHEGHEGHESHEGHEGDEGEEKQDSAGKDGSFCCFPRVQREDWWWPDQGSADEEQGRQDCEQGSVCSGQEELCNERAQEMDRRREIGAQAAQYHGLLRRERQDCTGEGSVRKGQEHFRQVTKQGCAGSSLTPLLMMNSLSIESDDLYLFSSEAPALWSDHEAAQ